MRLHTTCPGCRTVYNTPWDCQGKMVRCKKCLALFVVPRQVHPREPAQAPATAPSPAPATPAPAAAEPGVRPEQLREALQPILLALTHISDQVDATAELLPDIHELSNRKVLEELYDESHSGWKAEKAHLEHRLRELAGDIQELRKQNQKLESASGKRAADFAETLAALLPGLEFIEGSIEFMLEDVEEYHHVLRVLSLLQHEPKLLQMRDFQSAPGWLEVDKHISSGRSNDVRVYVKKGTGNVKYRVLVSRKGCQDRDKKRMQDAG